MTDGTDYKLSCEHATNYAFFFFVQSLEEGKGTRGARSDGDSIRVRLLAESQPMSEAEVVTPTLEDSYLWLLDKEVG